MTISSPNTCFLSFAVFVGLLHKAFIVPHSYMLIHHPSYMVIYTVARYNKNFNNNNNLTTVTLTSVSGIKGALKENDLIYNGSLFFI